MFQWGANEIGGAERLVVDAALGLQKLGHSVDIYTSHHDPTHCFDETRDGAWFYALVGGGKGHSRHELTSVVCLYWCDE